MKRGHHQKFTQYFKFLTLNRGEGHFWKIKVVPWLSLPPPMDETFVVNAYF